MNSSKVRSNPYLCLQDSDEGPPAADSSTFFRDGRRKIDFVLVYEENARRSSSVGSAALETHGDKKGSKLEDRRLRFMANLRRAGLDMEEVRDYFYSTRRSSLQLAAASCFILIRTCPVTSFPEFLPCSRRR